MIKVYSLLFFTLIWSTIFAQWERQYPFNHLGIINDINIKGDFGVAVGDDSAVFLSKDGGANWSMVDNELIGWNFETVEILGNIIYACGRGIYKSTDKGENFSIVDDSPTEIFDSYVSNSGELIVTNNEGVFRSLDGGLNFSSMNTPVDSLGVCSFILDENTIWWATAEPKLYFTTDGGLNWEENTTLTRPISLAFYDEKRGYASSLPYFYYTEDGGKTWEERGRLSRRLGKIKFGSTPDTAYMTSLNNFYYTTDGFNSFEEVKSILVNSDLNGLYIYNHEEILIGGSYSSIVKSNGIEEEWVDISGKVKPIISCMTSSDGQLIYAGGRNVILNSNNGGDDWSVLDSFSLNIADLDLVDSNSMVVSGNKELLELDLVTLEEKSLYGPTIGTFSDFHVTPEGTWIGFNTADYYIRSTDKGENWDSIGVEKFATGIDMDHQGNLYLKLRGKLLKSMDDGLTWDTIFTSVNGYSVDHFHEVDGVLFINESTRNVLKSTDGGTTWDSLGTPIGYSMIIKDFHFINRDTGYLFSSTEDQMYYTFDGGKTWPFSYVPRAEINGFYEFSDENTYGLWIFGYGAIIETQSTCLNPPLLSDIRGEVFPCVGDTTFFTVDGSNIDRFVWTLPDEWLLLNGQGNDSISLFAEDPGVGYLTVYGENSCGQTDALELQIAGTPIPIVEITQFDDVIRTDAEGEYYQWFLNGDSIPNADKDYFVPAVSGSYRLEVTFPSGCIGHSNLVEFISTKTQDIIPYHFKIYPNPTSENRVALSFDDTLGDPDFVLINPLGQLVDFDIIEYKRDEQIIALPNLPNGVYFFKSKNYDLNKKLIIQK